MSKNKFWGSLTSFFSRVPIQEKINFARHLSIVIKAGLPILEGLKIIQKQTQSPKLLAIISRLIADVNNGQFLADSLKEQGHRLFSDFFISVIKVGETSGTLSDSLLYLAEEMKKSEDLKSKVRSALIYPVIILVATVGVTGLLTFFVFPRVLPIFSSLRINLPLTTKILISALNFLLQYGLWLLGGLIILVVGLRLLLRISAVRFLSDRFLFVLPAISTLMINLNMANFTRVFGILLKSGIKIVETINITGQTFNNLVYRRLFIAAADEIRRGEQFARYLAAQKKFFPPMLSGMIEIGENTGNLEKNLAYLSEYYTEELESSLRNLTSLLEPLLLLVMGLIVGFVALSIITPIYEITQNIHP